MNIYIPNHDDELVLSLKEWCRNNPIKEEELFELGHQKIPAWNKGMPNSKETNILCGIAAKRKVMTAEMRENYRQSKLGNKNPNFGGKSWTKEAREKLSKTNTGKKVPKLVEWHKKNTCYAKMKVVCPHCNKEGSAVVMKRWHFDNCKNQ